MLHDERGVLQPLGGLELALGVDHLRAPLALGLRLAGHRALHVGGISTSFTSTIETLMPQGAVPRR